MERQASLHPADETLVSYGLGKLDDTLAGSVGKHLEQCDPCRRRVAELSSDSFLGRLQNAKLQQEAKPAVAQPIRTKTLVEAEPLRPSPAPEGQPAPKQPSSGTAPSSRDSLPPELVDHPQYEVLRELGRGGMGVVYLARNKLMDRLEVLKVLNKEMLAKQGRADRFLREIQSAARLHHPNVVAAYTALQMGDLLVFAMEYVEGDDLAKLVRARGPLPVVNACYFAYQAAQGLQHAHECGMIHRDIKPGNLILFRQGKKGIVKILDFGLAKVTSERGLDRTLTQEGQMLGTPDYIAPEQTLDAQKADIRADIYSLGCTLYHLLTGNTPFSGNSLYEVLQAHHSVEAKSLNLVRPEVPAELAAVVAKMMAKVPNRRYQTPAEVVQALKPFLKPGGLTSPQLQISQAGSEIERPKAKAGPMTTPDEDDADPHLAPMEAVQPAERWKSLIDASQFDRSSARSAIRKRPRRQPPWMWPSVAVGAVLFGLVTAWASGIFSVKTKDGVIVLKNLPPDADVFVDQAMVVVTFPKGGAPAEITVPPGSHEVQIKKGDNTARGKQVTVANGGHEEINVEFEPAPSSGSQQLASKTGGSEPAQPAPAQPDSTQPKPPALMVAPFDGAAAEKGQERWAAHLGSTVQVTNGIGMQMTLVPPGRFQMGSAETVDELERAFPEEKPSPVGEWPHHLVMISRPFYLGKYEVTKGQFKRFVQDAGYRTDAEKDGKGGGGYDANKNLVLWDWHPNFTWRNWGVEQKDDEPVVDVSHNDATAFCVWLSIKEGKSYRLPTEAEWEYGCRAGTPGRYYNGDDPKQLTKIGNVRDSTLKVGGLSTTETSFEAPDGYAFPSPVGKFLPNNFGLYDMLGNAWEWCADWYDEDYYMRSPALDPAGPPSGQNRVRRGGAWNNTRARCRAATRQCMPPDGRRCNGGFRVALSVVVSTTGSSGKAAKQDRQPQATQPSEHRQDGFVPLFNGKDLSGWTAVENGGSWTVDDRGVLVGKGSRETGKPLVLIADQAKYKDFKLSIRILNAEGEAISAIIRRSASGSQYSGYGIMLSDTQNSGGQLVRRGSLYRADMLKLSVPLTWDPIAKSSHVGEWYTLEITAIGNHITTSIDGIVVTEYEDPGTPFESGGLALVGRSDVAVQIREIEIQELGGGLGSYQRQRGGGFGGLGLGKRKNDRLGAQDGEDQGFPNGSRSLGGALGRGMGGMGLGKRLGREAATESPDDEIPDELRPKKGGVGLWGGLGGRGFGVLGRSGDADDLGFGPASKERFVRLFNGTDFTNWTFPKGGEEKWSIDDSVLRGDGTSRIATARTDFKDFHLRMSVRTPDQINKHLIFRSRDVDGNDANYRFHLGGIRYDHKSTWPLGSYTLLTGQPLKPGESGTTEGLVKLNSVNVPFLDDNWHRVEILALRNVFRMKLDGHEVSAFRDSLSRISDGRIMIGLVEGAHLELRDIEVNEKLAKPAAVAPKKSPRKSSKPAPANDVLREGTVWKGSRTYRKGFWQGVAVDYEIQVLKRLGPKFTGVKFDNGPGRNRLPVEGEIHGQSLAWREGSEWRMVGKLDGDTIAVQFHADFGNGKTEGSGQLKRSE